MNYDGQTSYFRFAPPGHTFAYKNVDNLFKNEMYIPLFGKL